MIGIHAMTGAFLFGLVVPTGPVAAALVDRTEEFLVNLLLPVFYIHAGMRFNAQVLWSPDLPQNKWPAGWKPLPHEGFYLVLIIALASACKVLTGLLVSFFFSTPVSEGLTLGFLLSIRGPVEIMLLGVGYEKQILSAKVYNVLLLGVLVVTAIASPAALFTHRPPRRHVAYKRRNLQRSKPDGELRMVACVHTNRNVPSIISLLEISNPTKRSPIFVYALHLIELSGRASAMLIVHNPIQTKPGGHHHRRAGASRGGGGGGGGQQQSEQIITAFENYEQHAGGISIQPLTAVSPYSSMHEDICSIAEDRHAALIVLPFHKAHTVGGDLETINPGIQSVNQKVLAHAPCSVAILVDRGLGAGAGAAKYAGSRHAAHNVAVLFFGGPDDREALAYAWRMAEHPGVMLTVVRFLPGADAAGAQYSASPLSGARSSDASAPMAAAAAAVAEEDVERLLDDEFVNEFRLKNVGAETVVYAEKVVNNSEETVGAIRSMETIHDLYVVGRGHGRATPLTAGLAEWSECAELGPIGDLLASSDFKATASVLVVQQYIVHGFAGGASEQPAAPDSPRQSVLQYLSKANHRASRPAAAVDAGWNGAGYRS
ncbi:Cation/H(+) antiporter 15 [Ananas comosus]|uniref:Cation/H(+) antiporter 15 n=1 Tax=Ananas comosus TaxID=4615 RepID=A0A199W2Z4_ANACO|nr:Cation/H(+) antiporter 15 [Ananas comosus]